MIGSETGVTSERRTRRGFLDLAAAATKSGVAILAGFSAILAVAMSGSALAQDAPRKGSAPASEAGWLAKELSGGKAQDPSNSETATHAEAGIQLGLAQAADGSSVYPTQEFRTNDRHIAVLFRLGDNDQYKKLTATFTAVDVGSALPPNSQVARGSMSVKAGDHGVFTTSVMRSPGKYKVEVFGDNQPWKSADFSIAKAADPMQLKDPGELLPVNKGRIWTYSFVQEIGKIGKVSDIPPGVTKGPDGKYHGEMKATVVDTDAAGAHVQYQRGGQIFLEEWWELDKHGLGVTKRITEGNTVSFDPPQTIWKLPLSYTGDWTFRLKDQNIHQKFYQWGPLPIKAPSSDTQGYIVLIEQSEGPLVMTVERHFAPGIGMVRQVYTTALGGKLVSREDAVLTGVQ